MERSPNCEKYTNSVSLLVDAEAVVPGDERCRARLTPVFSCQTSGFEAPDDVTMAALRGAGAAKMAAMGCDASRVEVRARTNLVGAQDVEYSGAKLAELGMASNCYRMGNDPNDATHLVRAVCTNQYDMTDVQGRKVRDTNKTFLSNLSTCDVSDAAMPQLMEDARKVAAHNAGVNGFTMRDTDLACRFSILPQI